MPKTWVTVRYFAVVKERIGKAEERLEVPAGALAGDVFQAVVDLHPGLGPMRGKIRLAVNEELVPDSTPVHDGDEVALIPPVAGGSTLVRLSETTLSMDEVIGAVSRPGAGGISVFLGIVRNENEGHAVTSLDYEAFGSMAIREMTRIAAEIEADLPGVQLAVVHRIGHLEVGEPAVVIAASAPHRADAFEATRRMIDRIKETVPIWKREHGPDGTSWVGAR
ncbi:MAG: molybdopterin converting factor subunit 1 [Deltaproteobacteria bacterium]|nr:molybdopterin converting factor subunit 1 [Deltaproteobacteria bacterium]